MRLSNKLLGASNMIYAIWEGSQCLPNDEDVGRRHAHTIDGPNPVILVRTHTQLDHDITRLTDLQHSDIGGIVCVNLQHYVNTSRLYCKDCHCEILTYRLDHVHETDEEEEMSVDFSHGPLLFTGVKGCEELGIGLWVVSRVVDISSRHGCVGASLARDCRIVLGPDFVWLDGLAHTGQL